MSPEVRPELTPYRRALALPGLRSLLLVAVLARIPLTATAVTLTLHVVLDLHRGYGAAGLGRGGTVARRSGRRCSAGWSTAAGCARPGAHHASPRSLVLVHRADVPYPLLLPAAVRGRLLALPVFSVVRQSIAALCPGQRRPRTRWTRCPSSCRSWSARRWRWLWSPRSPRRPPCCRSAADVAAGIGL